MVVLEPLSRHAKVSGFDKQRRDFSYFFQFRLAAANDSVAEDEVQSKSVEMNGRRWHLLG